MPTQTLSGPHLHIPRGSLWFGTAGAAVAWAWHGVICEVISSEACRNNIGSLGPLSPVGVRWLLAGITLGFLAIATAGGIVSYRNWQRVAETRDLMHAEGPQREQFMSLAGIFVSVAFVVGIIWAGLTLIFLDICMKAR